MKIINSNEVHIFDELPWDRSTFGGLNEFLKIFDRRDIKCITFYNVMRIIQVDTKDSKFFDLRRDEVRKLYEFATLEWAAREFNNEA